MSDGDKGYECKCIMCGRDTATIIQGLCLECVALEKYNRDKRKMYEGKINYDDEYEVGEGPSQDFFEAKRRNQKYINW